MKDSSYFFNRAIYGHSGLPVTQDDLKSINGPCPVWRIKKPEVIEPEIKKPDPVINIPHCVTCGKERVKGDFRSFFRCSDKCLTFQKNNYCLICGKKLTSKQYGFLRCSNECRKVNRGELWNNLNKTPVKKEILDYITGDKKRVFWEIK